MATRRHQFLTGVGIGIVPWCVLALTLLFFGPFSELTLAIPAVCYIGQVGVAIFLLGSPMRRWVSAGLWTMAILTPIMFVLLLLTLLFLSHLSPPL